MYRYVCAILRDEETEGGLFAVSRGSADRAKRFKLECHVNSAGASTRSSRPAP